jgi:hypothetical protein
MAVGRRFMVQAPHLGPTGNVRTAIFSALPYGGQVGQVHEVDAKFWRLVLIDDGDAVDYLDGGVAYYKDKPTFEVTVDASDAEGLANGIAGGTHQVIDVSGISADRWIFIQIGGEQAAVQVAASTVAADHLTGHASTDNILTRTAAGTAPVDKLAATALSTRGSTTSDEGATVTNSSKVDWVLGNLI